MCTTIGDSGHLFQKVFRYTFDGIPKNKCLIVLQDHAGWLYLKRRVEKEGLKTPFMSIMEIEMLLNVKLELIEESEIPQKEGGEDNE